jgi:peptidyl-prolyl cis-trans isomerase SurA
MTKYKLLTTVSFLCLCLNSMNALAQMSVKKPAPVPVPAKKISPAAPTATAAAPSAEIKLVTAPLVPTNVLREVDYIVGLVNSEPITRNEVSIRQRRLQAQWIAQGVSTPPEAEVFKRVLEQLIDERVMLQIAKDEGIRTSESQLLDSLTNVARQNQLASLAELKTKYEAEGGNWNNYREEIRGELTRVQVRERQVEARLRVSESEIDLALQEQNSDAKGAEDINLAQILIALPDSPTSTEVALAKARAEKAVAEVRKGADFTRLAEQASDAADKAKGGVMGLRAADRYPTLFVEATKGLKVGDVSDIQRSDAGFHILKLLERRSSSTATVVQSRVRHILLPITAQLNEEQAKAQLRGYKAQIESNRNSFSVLAREHSVDGSAAQGGDLGWTTPGLFVPEFERVMSALPIGKISDPFTSRFGVHLLEVVDRKAVAVSVREQREAVRNQLREKKAGEAYVLWIADARGRAFVEYKNAAQ